MNETVPSHLSALLVRSQLGFYPPALVRFLRERVAAEGMRLDCGINNHDGNIPGLDSMTCPCEFPAKWAWRANSALLEELLATADFTRRSDRDHQLLRIVATKYVDHPDYREEWMA